MFTAEYATVSDLSLGLTRRLVYASRDQIDLVTSADTQLHEVLVTADACLYEDFDLKKVWLTSSRWSSLVRQYIDPGALEAWLSLIETKLVGRKRGISFMRTEQVQMSKNFTTGRERRRYGSCMLGLGYKAMPRPMITLHSRTTYLGYIGQLDLALACVIAREVGQRVGLDPSQIAFTWHLEVAQFHGFKSLAFFWQYSRDTLNLQKSAKINDLRTRYPTLYLARQQLNAILKADDQGQLYGDMSFAQQCRVRRRYHTEVMGKGYGSQFDGGTRRPGSMRDEAPVLPSIPLSRLDLSPLRTRHTADDADNQAGFIEEADDD